MTKKIFIDYLFIMAGTFLLAYAVIAFWAPHNMVTGGLSGVAIIIAEYSAELGFEVPIWLTNLALNIPLFALGYKLIPKKYFFRSLFAYSFTTLALFFAESLPIPDTDVLLAAVFGGVIAGLGVGLVFRSMATTGGTTLAAEIVKRTFFKHMSVARVLFMIDSAIVLIGLLVFGPMAAMYAVIAIYVCTKVTEAILEGVHFAKAAYIISKESDAIAAAILQDMDRGCTELTTRGMFTKQNQSMLICVVSTKELVTLKQIVYDLDERAFVIVADVREVLGEGFKQDKE